MISAVRTVQQWHCWLGLDFSDWAQLLSGSKSYILWLNLASPAMHKPNPCIAIASFPLLLPQWPPQADCLLVLEWKQPMSVKNPGKSMLCFSFGLNNSVRLNAGQFLRAVHRSSVIWMICCIILGLKHRNLMAVWSNMIQVISWIVLCFHILHIMLASFCNGPLHQYLHDFLRQNTWDRHMQSLWKRFKLPD